MDSKNKDRVIIGLVIAVAILFANQFIPRESLDKEDNALGLFASEDTLPLDEDIDTDNPSPQDIEMKVHISGEIKNEGVYTIHEGDRLDDLVKRAGGLTDLANKKELNLAMKLEDQMKIYIPNIYEVDETSSTAALSIVKTPSGSSSDSDLIDINIASKEELMTLPNIGDKRADAIIEYREANPFTTIEDIKNVTGIGDKYFEAMKDLIIVR